MREPSTTTPPDAVPAPEGAGADEPTAIVVVPRNWDELREVLPWSCHDLPLDQLDLPPRVYSYTSREGLATLGDLRSRSQLELLEARGLGRLSVHRMFKAIRDYLGRLGVPLVVPLVPPTEAPHIDLEAERLADEQRKAEEQRQAEAARAEELRRLAQTGLLESWTTLLLPLSPTARRIVTSRAGLDGPAETIAAIAATLDCSRENVRQIELRALEALRGEAAWLDEIRSRARAVLARGAVPLAELTSDPWWAGIAARPEALDYFGERLLADELRVVSLSNQLYLAPFAPEAFDEAWIDLRRRAEQLAVPAPLAAFRALVDPFRERLGDAPANDLLAQLLSLLHVDPEGDGQLVLGMGTQTSATLTLLRASPVPLSRDEIHARVGHARLPDEVLHLGHGMVGLEHHIPDFAAWKERLVPPAVRVMERGEPPRQWHARDLLEALRDDLDVPEWISPWHLTAFLCRSSEVRYLGRNRFILSDAPEGHPRIGYSAELLRILRERGEPMRRDELAAALLQKTSFSEATFRSCLGQPPFLRCTADRYGLCDRDLPGGAAALAEATERAAALVARADRDLSIAEIHADLTRLSPAHARWTPEMCASVLRGDARFRFTKRGKVRPWRSRG